MVEGAWETVPCTLRREVGERRALVLECEKLHRRSQDVPDDAGALGLSSLIASHPGSLCPECGNEERVVELHTRMVYDTPDGHLKPGDLYWVSFRHEGGRCAPEVGGWTNCEGVHLHVVLPNGHHWDMDSRAANCTRPDDGEHRCWVRHGAPPDVTVNKEGNTCKAGRGSVKSGDFHGYLTDGRLVPVAPEAQHAHHHPRDLKGSEAR